ncbi:hypothetical protein [Rhabdothermincola salaria]|uniref:hypothetical protein n=1 Tax=Rhabdothermincola salaria TaxID=2903142 RepID=UPI001E5D379E|nr:hypothetical protein [Rhabdothermincola salaria]MCD9624009.1 hypothetical protein [Rhabdothermincola salaria]
MLRPLAKVGAAAAVLAAATLFSASPVSSQDSGPAMGYTLLTQGGEVRDCRLATIDLTTAEVNALPAAFSGNACVNDLAVAPDGTVWGIREGRRLALADASFAPQAESPLSLVAFDPTTGAVTNTVTIDIPGPDGNAFLPEGGLAITPDGTVWALFAADACDDGNQNCLWTIDPSTGSATLVGETGTLEEEMFGLAACSAGVVTLTIDGRNGPTSVPAFVPNPDVGFLDPATGLLTEGPAIADTVVGYDCSGSAGWALTGASIIEDRSVPQAVNATLTSFDPATGALSEIAAVNPAESDVVLLAVAPTVPPPPSTTTTTEAAPATTSAPTTTSAASPAVVTPRFTG